MNSNYRKALPGTELDYFDTREAVDRLEAGAYDRKAYLLDDAIFLWSLLFIGVTGYIVEAVRIVADRPAF